MPSLRSAALVIVAILCVGCTPALHPIAYRLAPEDQATLDRGWNKILARPTEPDRQLVLDALLASQLHHVGIDRFWFRAEKRFDKGWIVITSTFERTEPCNDRLDVDIFDHDRILLRRLSYTGIEVHQANAEINNVTGPVVKVAPEREEQPKTASQLEAEANARQAIEARKARVKDAFNPPEARE